MVRREAWRSDDGRRNIRHASSMPVRLERTEPVVDASTQLRDIGQGGVGLVSKQPLQPGETCRLMFGLLEYPEPVVGKVVWCKPAETAGSYAAGVQFVEEHPYSHARLVVDVCHVEFYRRDQRQRLGRELDHATAVQEWRNRSTATAAARV